MTITLITKEKIKKSELVVPLYNHYCRKAKSTDNKMVGVCLRGGKKGSKVKINLMPNGEYLIHYELNK